MVPADPLQNSRFGRAVAIDGYLAAVGKPRDNPNGHHSGSVYVFDLRTGTQLHKLTPSDGTALDEFGAAVAVSGNLVLVGAPRKLSGIGAAYVFDLSSSTPTESILPSPTTATLAEFGRSVALAGPLAVIGAPHDDHGMGRTNAGSAYVYELDGPSPTTPHRSLQAPSLQNSEFFGWSVAACGSRILIGARGNNDNGAGAGTAYAYIDGGSTFLRTLIPDGAAPDDDFGWSVGLCGFFAVVGAPGSDAAVANGGAAYLFDIWTGDQLAEWTSSSPVSFESFGAAVAISRYRALIGAPADLNGGNGSSHLFHVRTGRRLATFTDSAGESFDAFGHAVAVSGNLLLSGASFADTPIANSGAVFVHTTSGNEVLRFSATNAMTGDEFGHSLAIDSDFILAGATAKGNGGNGAVHLFESAANGTAEIIELGDLAASDGAANDAFGDAVDLGPDRILAGAPGSDAAANDAGAAYLYDLSGPLPVEYRLTAPDAQANDFFGDAVALSGPWAAIGARGDDADSGSVRTFDLSGPTPTPGHVLTATGTGDFGAAVAAESGSVMVGSPSSSDDYGAVFLFDLETGVELWKFTDPDIPAGIRNSLGESVALGDRFAIAGAPKEDSPGKEEVGSASVLDRATGQRLFKLSLPAPREEDEFGRAVAVDGGSALVSAAAEDARWDFGVVYAFSLATGHLIDRIDTCDSRQHHFARSVALSGGQAWVSHVIHDDPAAWLFELPAARPDALGGEKAGALRGNDHYTASGVGQLIRLVSRRARPVRAHLALQNDGEFTDIFSLLATRGNRFFKLKVRDPGGADISAAANRGTYRTPTLDIGAPSHIVSLLIKPNRTLLRKRKGRRNSWLRKGRTFSFTIASVTDLGETDRVKFRVMTKP